MSVTIEQIVLDLKRVCIKQKDREALGDSLISETESVNKQIEAMKEYQDDLEVLNKLARERSNLQLIAQIHQENPQIREIQQENRQLKACLEDHQHALEHIMQKYREHTQKKIKETKLDFSSVQNKQHIEIIHKQSEKIQEMAAVMRKATEIDEEKINKEYEYLSQLITENKGLREMLEISHKFGDNRLLGEDKATQTEESELNDSWSPNKPPLKSS
uniref:CSON007719 protein n=1 Tax=Culicoides sonorensis TaxID=179676 RepID=A0A336LY14_CULSO